MRFLHSLFNSIAVCGLLADVALAIPAALEPRALPNAPDGYAPTYVSCPSARPSIRTASKLSPQELAWLPVRRNNTVQSMKDWFQRLNLGSDFDPVSYIANVSGNASALPNIAIALSGGGYRALLNGAGAIKAFDNRTTNSTGKGQFGGLLQSATYVSGLSGGSWLVGSIYVNNFTTISALQRAPTWQLQHPVYKGPESGSFSTADYYKTILDTVAMKSDAGFNISITDYWGRALSYQFINATNGGPNYTWSSISLTPDFLKGNMPLPLVVADGRNPGEKLVGSNSTVYEFNPWEFGSFDPTVYGFAPLEYLGSNFTNGTLPSNETCLRGFDNAGFVMGTSSTLFNQFALQLNTTSLDKVAEAIAKDILSKFGKEDNDIAQYQPNPFLGWDDSVVAGQIDLNMVDGGEDGQNLPLQPLIQPERHVDVIFAVDSTSDYNNWPTGSSLVHTYERSLNVTGIANGTSFPAIPDQNTFVNLGLNTRPTFFGCNSSNTSSITPLVVYLPNYPYTTYSNTSTFDLEYNTTQRDAIIHNGYNVATMANSTRESDWANCAGCAILSRSFERTGTPVPSVCQSCFTKYCWNGTLDNSTPAHYAPATILDAVILDAVDAKSGGYQNSPSIMAVGVVVGMAIALL